jgi:nicotinate dehydrogenase subunit B
MTPVVKDLTALPDEDIRAMATYLASFQETPPEKADQRALATSLENATGTRIVAISPAGQRFYEGACAVCHEVGGPPLFGSRPSLALNSNLHATTPDNLIQVILHGITEPVSSDLGYMPAFADHMSDDQIADLVSYLRQRFASDKPAWADLSMRVNLLRAAR